MLVLKRPLYTRAERTSYNKNLIEYFTSGGCAGPEKANTPYEQREQASNNIEYFTLGGCAGLKRPIHTSRENKLQ